MNQAPTNQVVQEILAGRSRKGRLARLLPFLGPAFIASAAYIDPGNLAKFLGAAIGALICCWGFHCGWRG